MSALASQVAHWNASGEALLKIARRRSAPTKLTRVTLDARATEHLDAQLF
jgi:hypothetical protein